jgi:hypothetical protein
MAGTRAKGACKDASSLWVLEATAVMRSLPTKVRLLMVQTFIYSAVVWRGGVDTTKAVKDKMSAVVKKALRSILALHPRDCSLTFCTGTLGYFTRVYSLMLLPNCVGSTDLRTWGWPMAQGGAAILIRG